MSKFVSQGTCHLCQKTFSRPAMRRHLKACLAVARPATRENGQDGKRTFWLFAEDAFRREFWLHLEAPETATLATLDRFLRNIWLECCGHLSAFIIAGTEYVSHPEPEFEQQGMNQKLGQVLAAGMTFGHQYDFGSTTQLKLKVLAEERRPGRSAQVRLLARNLLPPIVCQQCGQLATQVCSVCLFDEEAWFCDACAPQHDCGEEAFLPVVNSPRVGVCAYSG